MRSYKLIMFIIFTAYFSLSMEGVFGKEKQEPIDVNVKCKLHEDRFHRNILLHLNKQMIDIIDKVKKADSIAIDLGAGIGTTSIYLSNNFYQVLAVEHDPSSIARLRENLHTSERSNIVVCDRPVSNCKIPIDELQSGKNFDNGTMNQYEQNSITFKQLVYDYIFAKDANNINKISFIKCDVDGREEDILEDILYYAYYNKCSVYVTFYLSQWKNKNISQYEYLFNFFKTNCPVEDPCGYLLANPSASILFEPLHKQEVLVKKNTPALIIGYNQVTFIKNMVNQLEKYTSDICIIDNNSDFQPLLDYYKNEYKYTLLKQPTNYGHTVFRRENIQKLVGDIYILTDPDLQFNPKLPDNFIEDFINISNHFHAFKVGFALLIDSDDIRTDIRCRGLTIKEWEQSFWLNRMPYPPKPALELYGAPIDTTFCLVNKRYPQTNNIRAAGDYTCVHIPWHKSFEVMLKQGEVESYLKNNKSTTWFGKNT